MLRRKFFLFVKAGLSLGKNTLRPHHTQEKIKTMKTLTLDSSQIATYLECPRKWHYQYVLHRRKYGNKKALNKGTFFHALLEAYYVDPSASNRNNILYLVLEAKNEIQSPDTPSPCLEKLKKDYNLKLDADNLALEPEHFDLVFRRFGEYCFHYRNNDFVVAEVCEAAGIELGFAIKVGESNETEFILDGRIDLLIEKDQFGLCWVDHKTESQTRNLYEKRIQFRNYDLALNINTENRGLGIINYLGLQVKPTKDTFRRVLCFFTASNRRHWQEYLVEKVFKPIMANGWKAEDNPNFFSCETKYGLCDYTQVCEFDGKSARTDELRTQYIQVEPWRPW